MPDEIDAFVPLTDRRSMRQALDDLLVAWETGGREPAQVFADARALWLSRRWPQQHEKGFDLAASDVLFMLASARDAGLTDSDIPALRDYLEATGRRGIGRARDRFYAHLEATIDDREALQGRDDYTVGHPTTMSMSLSSPSRTRMRASSIRQCGWTPRQAGPTCAPGCANVVPGTSCSCSTSWRT